MRHATAKRNYIIRNVEQCVLKVQHIENNLEPDLKQGFSEIHLIIVSDQNSKLSTINNLVRTTKKMFEENVCC